MARFLVREKLGCGLANGLNIALAAAIGGNGFHTTRSPKGNHLLQSARSPKGDGLSTTHPTRPAMRNAGDVITDRTGSKNRGCQEECSGGELLGVRESHISAWGRRNKVRLLIRIYRSHRRTTSGTEYLVSEEYLVCDKAEKRECPTGLGLEAQRHLEMMSLKTCVKLPNLRASSSGDSTVPEPSEAVCQTVYNRVIDAP